MKRILSVFFALVLAPSLALADGATSELKCDHDRKDSCIRVIDFPWLADSAGAATVKFDKFVIVGSVVNLQSVASYISETFDATITDEYGEDIMYAVGTTTDLPITTVTRSVVNDDALFPVISAETLTANITSAGSGSSGRLRLKIKLMPGVAEEKE